MNKLTYLTFTLLLGLSLSTTNWVGAQTAPPPPPPEPAPEVIFVLVEEKARPREDYKNFYRYISRNLRYPTMAYQQRIQGVVVVEFVVTRDGSLTNMRIVKRLGSGCDREAIRVLKKAPKWRPARQRGRPIRSKCQIPIRFKLR